MRRHQPGGAGALVPVHPSRAFVWEPATRDVGALLSESCTLSLLRVERVEQWGHLVMCEGRDVLGGARVLLGVTDLQITVSEGGEHE